MKKLIPLLALALASCSYTGYWGANMKVMIDEPVLPGVPLARSVKWSHRVTYGKSEPTLSFGTLGFSDDKTADRDPAEPEPKMVSGTDFIETNLMVARKSPGWDDEASRGLIREGEAALARARALKPPEAEKQKHPRTWVAPFGGGEYGDVAAWALGDYVSRDAPEGSRLIVMMNSASTGTDFGWTWQQRVTVILERGNRDVVSVRATPWHIYTSPPSTPPADCVLAEEVLAGHQFPPSLYQHYDLGILLRSAATEIAHGQRIFNAALIRIEAERAPKRGEAAPK